MLDDFAESSYPGCDSSAEARGIVLAGRYRLIERIACDLGGLSWRCQDLELDDEEVVLKLFPRALAEAREMYARVREEARLVRRVTHPNVARVFEFACHEGLHMLTMEYIAGESLRSWIERDGPLWPDWALMLGVGLCRGLAAALAVGVLHGMIQASNILLAPRRGAVVTGFGVAPALEVLPPGRACHGNYLAHVAPERLDGGPISPQSDVFAVGVVLFQALTGRLPWATGDVDIRSYAANRGPAPALRDLAPHLPRAWEDLIRDCLDRDPGRRPGDVRRLLVRLDAVGLSSA